MKTLTLILSLSLVLTSATVGAQQTAGTEADNQGGFISIEALNADGSVVHGVVSTPRIPDENLERAACCVQPEQGEFKNSPIVKAIEAIAAYYTTKAVVSISGRRTLVDICDKVNFVAALNSNPHFQSIKQQHKNGVVLQIKKTDVIDSALVCLSR